MRAKAAVGSVAALVAVGAVAAALLVNAESYEVTARFSDAGQLITGSPVQVGGQSVGKVTAIELTEDGQADVTLELDDTHSPLPEGTRASVRQLSLSGLANKFVDLEIAPGGESDIPDGGRIGDDRTSGRIDVDQVFAMLDGETRADLKRFLAGQAAATRGRAKALERGLRYLNPALSVSSKLFAEATRDAPLLRRTLVDSARVVTALGTRRDELALLVREGRDTVRALATEKLALRESVRRLPPFMRGANSAFVNLRAALGDVDPLLDAAIPVARRLRPVMAEARPFAAAAVPSLRDLRLAIRRSGDANDLIDLMRGFPPLADIATLTRQRTLTPGGRPVDVGKVPGAFAQVVDALAAATPTVGEMRPYTSDLLATMDDYVASPKGYDALGKTDRAFASVRESIDGGPVFPFQYHRCPGGAEERAPDGSNVLDESERERLECSESERALP